MKTCPRVPKEDMYMDLHYASGPAQGGGRPAHAGGSKRKQRGGDASFKVLDHIVSLGLDKDAFETAARAGWTVLANLGRGGFGSVDHIRINMPTGPAEYVMKTLFVCPKAQYYAHHEYDAHKYLMDVQTTEPTDILMEHIIPAIALGETETALGKNYHIFFERELGTSLNDFIKEKKERRDFITLAQNDEIKDSLTAALSSVHNAGVIHRDIKPHNLFIITNAVGLKYKIKIIDFGLAILSSAGLQNPGAGTPDYFSPEHEAALARYWAAKDNGIYNNANPAFKYRYSAADDNYAMEKTNRKVMQIASPVVGLPPLHMLAAMGGPPQGPPQGPQYRPVGARGRLLKVTNTETPITTPPDSYSQLPSPIGPIGMAVNPGAMIDPSISSIRMASSFGGYRRSGRVKKTDRRTRRNRKVSRRK
jgi:serine/threonine protein kinase